MSELYLTRDEIVGDMLSQLQGAIPDVYVGDDGTIFILFSVQAGQLENAFLANQILLNDMFVQTASLQALIQHGVQYGQALKEGTVSVGTLQFEGAGGTYIPALSEAAYDPGNGLDLIYFRNTIDGTIPNPGTPSAPTVGVGSATGLTGTYEYVVTFATAAGETLPSAESAPVTVANQKVNLTNIPIGGAGTTQRKIYRDKNGANDYHLVATINDNTTTAYTDSISDATVAASAVAPTVDTARRITLAAESVLSGVETNVGVGTVTELVTVPATLTGVTNPSAFTGGSDQEEIESFRRRLLDFLQNPQTGSPGDLKSWAEGIAGVDSATVFSNDNLGTPTNGHTTVRISGPGGAVPSAAVQQAVLDELNSKDLANITIHVGTFTPVSTDVTVDVTTSQGYTLSDVSAGVQLAISNYITSLPVAGTMKIAEVIAAVIGLVGVDDVTVTSPGTNLTTATTAKRIPGTISVT
jgi:uncharacterized phage protein gp47/JayE